MPVTTTKSSKTFQGNGVTVIFDCDFRIFEASDIVVSKVDTSTGTKVDLALNTDYTISGANDDDGFTVTTSAPVPTGINLLVRRAVPFTQPTSFTNQSRFFPVLHQDMADRLEMQIQQISEQATRVITYPDGLGSEFSGELPYPIPGNFLGWNSDGTKLVNAGSAIGTALGFLQKGINAVVRFAQDKLRERVSPEDFGAVGDGVADDTVAINRALASLTVGGELYLPGKYLVSGPVNLSVAGTSIRGKNWNSSTITSSNPTATIINITGDQCMVDNICLTYSGSTPTTTAAKAISVISQNVSLSNFRILNVGIGVFAANSYVLHMVNFQIQTFSQAGIFYSNWIDSYVANFVIQASVGAAFGQLGGIYAQSMQALTISGGDILAGAHAVNMTNCAYWLMTNLYMDSTRQESLLLQSSFFCTLTNCWFSGGRGAGTPATGCFIGSGNNIKLVNCQMYNNGGSGAFVGSTAMHISFDSCSIDSNGQLATAGTAHGIVIDAGCQYFTIRGCSIRNSIVGSNQTYGIFINTGNSDFFVVTDNLIGPNTTGSIFNGAAGRNVVMSDSNIGYKQPFITQSAFTSGWVNYDATNNPVGYLKDESGIVHLRGALKSGTLGTIAFVLPTSMRPEKTVNLSVVGSLAGAAGWIYVTAAGEVTLQTGSTTFMCLDGASFKANG